MGIRLDGVSKFYGQQAAVENVSFEANAGEIVGLLGPNGAGKSTTMKMICGYVNQDEGTILVNGKDVSLDALSTRQDIGYLAEQNPMYADMYVREFLHFNSQVHKLKNAKFRIDEVINLTGLEKEQNKFIRQLSKGYKQRVGLAQAILHDPEILILDEPISGLDPNQLVEIRSLIKQLGESKTILFSSHILQEVEQICDRLLVLSDGALVLDGTMDEVRRKQSGQSLLQVVFEQPVDLSGLLTGNEKLKAITATTYHIQTDRPGELKKEIFDLAVAQQIRISELVEEKSSMENVFQRLTNSDT